MRELWLPCGRGAAVEVVVAPSRVDAHEVLNRPASSTSATATAPAFSFHLLLAPLACLPRRSPGTAWMIEEQRLSTASALATRGPSPVSTMEHVTTLMAQSDLDDAPTHPQTSASAPEPVTTSSSQSSRIIAADDPPPRTHLSTPKHNFELLASRTVSQAVSEEAHTAKLPASPLDSINPCLYPRFPRFSITTESSHPDLSTDEVTSTKISLDEEGMVAARRSSNNSNTKSKKRQKLQITLHRAVSTPTLGLRRFGNRIKRAPSILLSRRTSKRLPRTVSDSQAEVCLTWSTIMSYVAC